LRGLGRLAGVVVRPVRTLTAILAGGPADPLEPVVLAVLAVAVTSPVTVATYVLAAEASLAVAFSRLFSVNGFIWGRLANQGLFCLVAGLGLYAVAWLARSRVGLGAALTAGLYLYVPMGVLTLGGGLLARAGVVLPWLPSHPLAGWWVMENGVFHRERVVVKLVVEMAWPAVVGLVVAWRVWRQGRGQALVETAPPP
jgi:hypothetical protein